MENPSDIQRDSFWGSSELSVRSTWCQVWEEDKAKQKQYEPTYPVFGLHMRRGWQKEEGGWQNNKEKEWSDANLSYMEAKRHLQCLQYVCTKLGMKERKHKRVVGDDCNGNDWVWNGREMSWLGGAWVRWRGVSVWARPGQQQECQPTITLMDFHIINTVHQYRHPA